MKIAISVGHYPERPGHRVDALSEYSENLSIAGELARSLAISGHKPHIVPTGTLPEKVDYINTVGFKLAVELHFNDFHRKAVGCETLYDDRNKNSERLAQRIQIELIKKLSNRDRGIKVRRDLYFLRECECSSVIVEPFFMRWEPNYLADLLAYQKIASAVYLGIQDYLYSD
jgi:N-acetylmuramoyl-L-alanine amidase